MPWLRLIRWPNLLIIFVTQFLAWACVVLPVQELAGKELLLSGVPFLYICASTVLIAAAGYIINDYFDIRMDVINRPEKLVLENMIPRRQAMITHTVLNVVAIALAAIVVHKNGHYEWLLLQLACTALLWFYSTHFKRMFLVGNVVVSLLTALTIIILIVYEPAMHRYITAPVFLPVKGTVIPNPVWVLGVYAYFAFMLTWMREIVKDMEDHIGDMEEGCVTMPIKWGLERSVRFVQLLSLLAMIPLVIAGIRLLNARWLPLGIYILAALVLPVLAWTVFLQRKATTKHYHLASRYLKYIMVAGIVSLLIYHRQAHG